MSRFRLTSSESLGIAMLLICIAMPIAFHIHRSSDPRAQAMADSIRQARIDSIQHCIDSAQHRSDSIADARIARKLRRDSLRTMRRAARAFRPTTRDRLADTVAPIR